MSRPRGLIVPRDYRQGRDEAPLDRGLLEMIERRNDIIRRAHARRTERRLIEELRKPPVPVDGA